MTPSLLLALLLAYFAFLFVVAWRGDRVRARAAHPVARAVVYGLSLGVLCSSWTYFSAIAQASFSGWDFLLSYAGPIFAMVFGYPLFVRIALAAKRENVGSLSDFLSARYGKSRWLGSLVAAVCLLGAIPFIAIQLRCVAAAWVVFAGQEARPEILSAAVAGGLAVFAVVFGARRSSLTAYSRGLVRAVAVETVVKVLALLIVAAVSGAALLRLAGKADLAPFVGPLGHLTPLGFHHIPATLAAAATVLCLAPQFHITFVELEDVRDLRVARWVFPACLALACASAPPIAAAGLVLFRQNGLQPDLYVVGVPLALGAPAAAAFAFMGGVSTAAALVTVHSVAVSGMVTNELILPLLGRLSWRPTLDRDVSHSIVAIRRAVIVVLIGFAYVYSTWLGQFRFVADATVTSYLGAAQLLPALVGSVVWRRGHRNGAIAGILCGTVLWIGLVAAPQVLHRPLLFPQLFWRIDHNASPLLGGMLCSLGANLLLYVVGSLAARPKLIDRVQAAAFAHARPDAPRAWNTETFTGTVGDLKALVAHFVGKSEAERAFHELEVQRGAPLRPGAAVDAALARAAERMLAGAIGASSARTVTSWALAAAGQEPTDIARALDEAAQAVQFNRELLQSTLDHLSQAVSVVDSDLRLIAWNRRYLELFELPAGSVFVGQPLEDVVRASALREGYRPEVVDDLLAVRLAPVREGRAYSEERQRSDGVVLKCTGAPMAGGGYVTSFTDVTELQTTADALALAKEHLEERVEERTRELSQANAALADANAALAQAKASAEQASRSQARFLAAASHDLLQPLHAARLFLAAMSAPGPGHASFDELVEDVDLAIDSADRLLRSLLNLARLEVGGVAPNVGPVSVLELMRELQREFEPQASSKGLRLRFVTSRRWVRSDRDLLRSVLQNLIGNAIRYTSAGTVLVGCRRAGPEVRFEVHDTGLGIPLEAKDEIFKEFRQLSPSELDPNPGAGLGLAIADRICRQLDHRLELRASSSAGSVFSVTASSARKLTRARSRAEPPAIPPGLRVLCVDNDSAVLRATTTLLRRWNVEISTAQTYVDAVSKPGRWDVVLADFHLNGRETGIDVIAALGGRATRQALVTADATPEVLAQARSQGVAIIRKPMGPASLRALLASAASVPAAAE